MAYSLSQASNETATTTTQPLTTATPGETAASTQASTNTTTAAPDEGKIKTLTEKVQLLEQ